MLGCVGDQPLELVVFMGLSPAKGEPLAIGGREPFELGVGLDYWLIRLNRTRPNWGVEGDTK